MSESKTKSELVDILLDFGETMMDAGAEISRVEDSLSRMGMAFGAVKTSAFAINSSIEFTVCFPDGEAITRTRRIRGTSTTDFAKLHKLNALSRRCAVSCPTVAELRAEVDEIRSHHISAVRGCIGSILVPCAFSVFFGGSILDGAIAGVFGLIIWLLQLRLAPLAPNKIFFLFLCSLLTTTGICLVNEVLPGLQIDKVIIGDIMLLVPGIAITTAVRDALVGDTISGITKLSDSLVWAAALAAGVMIVIRFFAG